MIGLSWFGLEVISIALPLLISHAHPEPKRVAPAAANFSLNVSKLPKLLLMALARLPTGAPPLPGPMIVQNIEWLMWPPPLLRTAVRIASGTAAQLLASSSSIDLPARSGADSSALFRFVTYAL